jgi:peptide deformylase
MMSARVLQHELDHLDGILFIDKISFLNKLKIRDKLNKLKEKYNSNKKSEK